MTCLNKLYKNTVHVQKCNETSFIHTWCIDSCIVYRNTTTFGVSTGDAVEVIDDDVDVDIDGFLILSHGNFFRLWPSRPPSFESELQNA